MASRSDEVPVIQDIIAPCAHNMKPTAASALRPSSAVGATSQPCSGSDAAGKPKGWSSAVRSSAQGSQTMITDCCRSLA